MTIDEKSQEIMRIAHYYLNADLEDETIINDLIDDIFTILDHINTENFILQQSQSIAMLATILEDIITTQKLASDYQYYIKCLIELSEACMNTNKGMSATDDCNEKFQYVYRYTSSLKLALRKRMSSIPKEIKAIFDQNITNKAKVIELLCQAIKYIVDSELPDKIKKYSTNELEKIIEQLKKERTNWSIINNKLVLIVGLFGSLGSLIGGCESLINISERLNSAQQTILESAINPDYFKTTPVELFQFQQQQLAITSTAIPIDAK